MRRRYARSAMNAARRELEAATPFVLRFVVEAQPLGQPRHRTRIFEKVDGVRRCSRCGLATPKKKPIAQLYDVAKGRHFKAKVADIARAAMDGHPLLEGPVQARLVFISECPKSEHRVRTPAPRAWATTKPDIDNLEKIILDACNGVVFADDKLVVRDECIKVRGRQGEPPRILATFFEIPEAP